MQGNRSMIESNSNRSNSHRKLRQRLAGQFAYLRANNLRTGPYEEEYGFLEEVLTDKVEADENVTERQERRRVEVALQKRSKRIRENTSTTDHVIGGYRSNALQPLSPTSSNGANSIVPRHGGYDGETAVGFYGTWNSSKFRDLTTQLESAKQKAGDSTSTIISLADQDVEVLSAGIKSKKEKSDGITLFIHHNPMGKTIQPVRVKYGAEALLTNSLFSAHAHVLEFLSLLGFEKTDEKISRVDAQIMLDVSVSEFACLILEEHLVTKFRKDQAFDLLCAKPSYIA